MAQTLDYSGMSRGADGVGRSTLRSRLVALRGWLPSRRRWEPWRDWAIIALVNNAMLLTIALLHLSGVELVLAGLPLGLGFAIGTLTVLHDGGHRMYSQHPFPNIFATQTSTPVGLWVGHWGLKHRVHHKLSQIYPIDESTRSSGVVRLHPGAPSRPIHRTQHVHAFFMYGLAWAGELRSQITYLRTGVVTGCTTTPGTRARALSFGLEKTLWLLVLTPYAVILGPLRLAIVMLVAMTAASVLAAIALVVGHINDGLEVQSIDDDERWDWATNLMRTTASFATDSVALRWLTGGLTLHLAHHLRPMAVRSELPDVHETTVAEFAERTHLPSIEFPTFHAALAGHYRRLRQLGKQGETRPMPLVRVDTVRVQAAQPALQETAAP